MTDPDYSIHYQIVSRCVRRSWLCGVDRLVKKNYAHRKDWLKQRMLHLTQYFAVAIDAFAIMSNDFYLIVYFDPQASFRWTHKEVPERRLRAPYPAQTSPLNQIR